MGRLGPLTSQGLGRSPYDEVVQGEGESDPREPLQQYDERGRPVNPATRQINKDIIRSHNEVMQVIGVAEPENMFSEPQALSARHQAWENAIGYRLVGIGRFIHASSAWGVNGMRQRILLYKDYSHVPLFELWSYERRQRSLGAIVFAGAPAYALFVYNRLAPPLFPWIIDQPLYHVAKSWVRLHLHVFAMLQQLDIIPAYLLFPALKFFIPFSSSSPIPAPSPPASLTPGEILRWAGRLALNAAPLLAVYACNRLGVEVRVAIWRFIRERLPTPMPRPRRRSSRTSQQAATPAPEAAAQSTTPPHSPAPPRADPAPEGQPELNSGGFPTTSQMRPRDSPLEQPEPNASGPVAPGPVRRQSSFSARGGGGGGGGGGGLGDAYYGSDDEDNNSGDMVSTTLISFDVEATDATDPPPGQWSAELRPNVVGDGGSGRSADGSQGRQAGARQPAYWSTTLTRLPSQLAADVLAWVPTRFLWAPVEAVAWRWLVRSLLGARGLGAGHVYPVWSFGVSRHAVADFVGIELVYFFMQTEIWATMYQVASYFRLSEEEWSYVDSPSSNQVD